MKIFFAADILSLPLPVPFGHGAATSMSTLPKKIFTSAYPPEVEKNGNLTFSL
ncbi:MAG: hypothetical protein JW774_11255 [Candidatus Aureabacteria bacterium]|nr:hypothetical protein [Candidatus Auribacterota bacterium]